MSLAWSTGDRLWLWRAIAAVAIVNLVLVALALGEPSVVPPHPAAPAWLIGLAGSRALVATVAVVGIVAAVASGGRNAGITPTVVWLVASAVLVEADAARGPGPYRGWFFVGAVGLGIVVGRAWARAGRRRDLEPAAGELGALALLAACYVGAASSKLVGSGASWADPTTLRAVALAHAHVDDPGAAAWLASSPAAAQLFAWTTVAIQLGAIGLIIGSRSRVIAALALVAFHVGVAVFARIGYWSAVALLLALALPWPRWIATLRVAEPDPPLVVDSRGDRSLAVILAAVVALAWLLPLREYTSAHHRSRTLEGGGASASREPLTTFGPIAVGDPLVDGWRIDAIEREPKRVMIVLAHPDHGRAVLWISARRAGDPGSPFDRGTLRIAYEGSDRVRLFATAAVTLADRVAADPNIGTLLP